MHLDAAEAVSADGRFHECRDATAIALRVHERETVEQIRTGRHTSSDLSVGFAVVGVEGREEHGPVDAGVSGPFEIGGERRIGVPRPGEAVAFPGVAVAVDDQAAPPRLRESPAISPMLVSIADQKVGRWSRSFGPCMPSSGSPNPIKSGGCPSTSCSIPTAGTAPPARSKAGALPHPLRYASSATGNAG